MAVTSASSVTATSAMVAELAALQTAYAAASAVATTPAPTPTPTPAPLQRRRFDSIPRELTSVDRAKVGGAGELPAQTVLYYQFVVDDPTGPGGQTRSNAMAGHSP